MRHRFLIAGLFALSAAALAAPAVDVDKAWSGSWRLDPARSHFSGATFEIAATPKGFHFVGAGGADYTFACDGKDYPVAAGGARTLGCTKNADGSYATWSKLEGKETSRSQRSFSADGMTMIVNTTSNGSDGKPVQVDGDTLTATNVFRRVVPAAEPAAKGKAEKKAAPKPDYAAMGLVGRWENTHSSASAPTVALLTVRGEVLHVEYPADHRNATVTLDGKDAPVSGENAQDKQTLSITPEGASVWHLVTKIDGEPTEEAMQSLSTDGKTLTSIEWKPGREKEKSTFVYEKQ